MERIIIIIGLIFILVFSSLFFTTIGGEETTATIIYVDDDGTADYTRIQHAIDNASDGDTIYVFSGTYKEQIVLQKSVKLIGEDKNQTIIDGDFTENTVNIYADYCTLENFTIINSNVSSKYSGIRIFSGHNTLTNNTINNCRIGIDIKESNNEFMNNTILNSLIGMDVYDVNQKFMYNDYFLNEVNERIRYKGDCIWYHNYWGANEIIRIPWTFSIPLPLCGIVDGRLTIDFDWFPAKTPNNI
jgi:parallel beta-helix repeat protein